MHVVLEVSWTDAVAHRSDPGTRLIQIDLAAPEWTEERRNALLQLGEEMEAGRILVSGLTAMTLEALLARLDAFHEEQQRKTKEREEARQQKEEERLKREEKEWERIRTRLEEGELPPALYRMSRPTLTQDGVTQSYERYEADRNHWTWSRLEQEPKMMHSFEELVARLNANRLAEAHDKLQALLKERQDAELKRLARTRLTTDILDVCLTEEQRERWKADMLPAKERDQAIEDYVFERLFPSSSEPAPAPYRKLTPQDIGTHHEDCEGYPGAVFNSTDANEVDAMTWAASKALEARIDQRQRGTLQSDDWEVSLTIRDHTVHCGGCPSNHYEDLRHRYGARIGVKHTPTNLSWSREYALD